MKSEEQPEGNCIEIGCKNVISIPDLLFCYAWVMGQGPLAGRRILHAWNEKEGIVYDFSNNREIITEKENYYSWAKITEEDVTKQTRNEVAKLLLKHKTYGGWIK